MQIHWISALYGCGLWSDGASSTKAIQYVTVKDSFITAALKIGTSMDLSMEEQLQLKMSNYQSSEMRIIPLKRLYIIGTCPNVYSSLLTFFDMPKMKLSCFPSMFHKSTIAIAAKPVSRLGPGYQRKNVYSYFIQRKVFLNINNFCTSAGLAS